MHQQMLKYSFRIYLFSVMQLGGTSMHSFTLYISFTTDQWSVLKLRAPYNQALGIGIRVYLNIYNKWDVDI